MKVAGEGWSAWTWEGPHVSETTEAPVEPNGKSARTSGGLSGKLLPELKQIAGGLGIKGVSSMKKAQLVEAIRSAQSSSQSSSQASTQSSSQASTQPSGQPSSQSGRGRGQSSAAIGDQPTTSQDSAPQASAPQDERARGERTAPQQPDVEPRSEEPVREPRSRGRDQADRGEREERQPQRESRQGERNQGREQNRDQGREQSRDRDQNREQSRDRDQNREQSRDRDQNREQNRDRDQNRDQGNRQNREDEDLTGNRRRRRRGRERQPGGQPTQGGGFRDRRQPQEVDMEVTEDDVLVPVAGIVDILENYAFVRTSGYLPGPDDIYVSLSMVRKYGLRKGDAVTGEVRQPREGDSKQKFNPLINLETVNGGDVEAAKHRVDFNKLTPLYASERLRLETESTNLIGRVIDIAAPIGKGQRGLIVSPSKAGKTMIMQSIANSITTNNPECHLMVVLVDERPEEVTDFQRSVKGEVISSTFDRPASDHTMVAELAIERAKRLVELGHDVVVLLDGITRLGRAYNLAAPASGRILSGGVDSAALYPPKRFFGAARNIEDGGSLTILATALIESGSKMDEVIFEEFKGTGNMEIRLRRDFADKRLFPAIDAVQSGTRREELLMSKEELAIVWKLRRVLSGLDGQQALELLLERLKKTQSNIEFLLQVQKTTPGSNNDD
jgi:transcription termination factor Rho